MAASISSCRMEESGMKASRPNWSPKRSATMPTDQRMERTIELMPLPVARGYLTTRRYGGSSRLPGLAVASLPPGTGVGACGRGGGISPRDSEGTEVSDGAEVGGAGAGGAAAGVLADAAEVRGARGPAAFFFLGSLAARGAGVSGAGAGTAFTAEGL